MQSQAAAAAGLPRRQSGDEVQSAAAAGAGREEREGVCESQAAVAAGYLSRQSRQSVCGARWERAVPCA